MKCRALYMDNEGVILTFVFCDREKIWGGEVAATACMHTPSHKIGASLRAAKTTV